MEFQFPTACSLYWQFSKEASGAQGVRANAGGAGYTERKLEGDKTLGVSRAENIATNEKLLVDIEHGNSDDKNQSATVL